MSFSVEILKKTHCANNNSFFNKTALIQEFVAKNAVMIKIL